MAKQKTRKTAAIETMNIAAALLRLAAVTIGRSDTALGAFYRRLAARAGKANAVTATARKIAVLFYNTLRHGMTYKDPGAPNQKWAGDISYVWIKEGWLYLAVILELHSRRIIGWAVSNRMKRDLAIRALNMAIAFRSPPEGCIHHTDRGSQGGFNRSSQHPFDGGVDDENRQTKVRTFDTGQIKFSRKAASLAT